MVLLTFDIVFKGSWWFLSASFRNSCLFKRLFNSLSKLFLWVGQRENSDWSFVMRLFPPLQTVSEYFLVLAFKSPIRRIEPWEENISMSFSSSSNNSTWNTVNYMEVYKGHTYRYLWRFWHSLCQSWTIANCRSFWQLKSSHEMYFKKVRLFRRNPDSLFAIE